MPTVAAVATLEPEVAANRPQAAIFECISPPGSHDTHLIRAPYMRSAKPERNSISPSRMNKGTDTSKNSLLADQVTSPIARVNGNCEKIASRNNANTPSEAATGIASAINTNNKTSAVPIMAWTSLSNLRWRHRRFHPARLL